MNDNEASEPDNWLSIEDEWSDINRSTRFRPGWYIIPALIIWTIAIAGIVAAVMM